MKCLGSLCPASLEMINTPKFVIRAGIIPYVAPSGATTGKMLLGIKEGKYTDFGGGCKVAKLELPFDCAVREMREEIGDSFRVDLDRITHIFISGKTKPHQVVLFVRVDGIEVPRKIPEGELERVEVMYFPTFSRIDRRRLQPSLKSIYDMMTSTMSKMK
jgi:hypothetical protein